MWWQDWCESHARAVFSDAFCWPCIQKTSNILVTVDLRYVRNFIRKQTSYASSWVSRLWPGCFDCFEQSPSRALSNLIAGMVNRPTSEQGPYWTLRLLKMGVVLVTPQSGLKDIELGLLVLKNLKSWFLSPEKRLPHDLEFWHQYDDVSCLF